MSDSRNAAICIYCGDHVIYDTRQVTDMEDAHRQLVEHDQKCLKNPLVRHRNNLREALELVADIDAHGPDDTVCRHLLMAVQQRARAALLEIDNG